MVGGRHGTFLAFPSDAYLGEALLKYGEYGEAEFQFLREIWDALPSPRGCIVEVGANAGYLTVPLMTLADVVAFEPQPPVFELLKKHVVQNGVPGLEVQVFNLAVSDAPGSVPCPVVPFSAERCNHGGISMGVARDYDNIEVPCVTLDQKIAKPV
ncbi:MAG: FkbM family methyltransferase, partial [Euryarchaeota archaeon]|nr:FkbM family methyltransferase [Euryarchaeota archaeon]